MRCIAHARTTGKRCARSAIAGATVCRMHGGAAPQVKAAAEARLLALRFPAIAALEGTLEAEEHDMPQVRAALGVLDGPVRG